MEVGKLITSETCGSIFYFVVDETHPDEPQPDASKCYYVVAPSSSTFSYREAYCVLCRALCGVENRTYLHRWHSLHEQIFGTTPFIRFVNAVRESPLTRPNSLNNVGASPSSSHDGGHTPPTVTLPALFLDETTARLALHNAEKEHQLKRELNRRRQSAQHLGEHQQEAPSQRHGVLQACSTPVDKQQATKHLHAATASAAVKDLFEQPRLQDGKGQAAGAASYIKEGTLNASPEEKLDTLLKMATNWQEGSAALRNDDERSVSKLQQELRQERLKRLEAEEKCLKHIQALEDARAAVRQQEKENSIQKEKQQPLPKSTAEEVDHNISAIKEEAHKKEVAQLRRRVQELELELMDTKKLHVGELDRVGAEKEALKQQLWQQSQAQGAQIKEFLRENAGAVKRVEQALERRQKELCAVYTQALEERDVRIAQLSQEVLQHIHSSRQLATTRSDQERFREERVAHLEDMNAQLKEWNAALRQQLSDAYGELRDVRQRLQAASLKREVRQDELHSLPLSQQQLSSSPLRCSACAGLPHAAAVQLANHLRETQDQLLLARTDAEKKSQELHRAAQVIEQLMHGVQKLKLGVDAYRPQHVVSAANALRNISPLKSTI